MIAARWELVSQRHVLRRIRQIARNFRIPALCVIDPLDLWVCVVSHHNLLAGLPNRTLLQFVLQTRVVWLNWADFVLDLRLELVEFRRQTHNAVPQLQHHVRLLAVSGWVTHGRRTLTLGFLLADRQFLAHLNTRVSELNLLWWDNCCVSDWSVNFRRWCFSDCMSVRCNVHDGRLFINISLWGAWDHLFHSARLAQIAHSLVSTCHSSLSSVNCANTLVNNNILEPSNVILCSHFSLFRLAI